MPNQMQYQRNSTLDLVPLTAQLEDCTVSSSSCPCGAGGQPVSSAESATLSDLGTEVVEVMLPGGGVRIIDTAAQLGRAMSNGSALFSKGTMLAQLQRDNTGAHTLVPVKTERLRSLAEEFAQLVLRKSTNEGVRYVPGIISENTCKAILAAPQFLNCFREIGVLSPCPVLVPRTCGSLDVVIGYDSASKIMAFGSQLPEISLEESKELLLGVLDDYRFSSEFDRARAFASLLTPALVHGGILEVTDGGRPPLHYLEADHSQAGKGYFFKIVTTIYGHPATVVSQRRRGIGSMEESFDSALIKGAIFICFDNLRGKIDLPALESFLTETSYTARIPYVQANIDPRRVVSFATSNDAEITPDLANRSLCVRILKQPEGHQFKRYTEGNLLSHIRANQSKYIAAVFTIIRHWWDAGRFRTNETRHDFRPACQILDWIVQNTMGMPPLMEAHVDMKRRITNSALSWLRKLAAAVINLGQGGKRLQTNELIDICEQGGVEIPGINEGELFGESDSSFDRKACQGLGRRLRACFRASDRIVVDHMTVERVSEEVEREGHGFSETKFYIFNLATPLTSPTAITTITPTHSQTIQPLEPPTRTLLAD